MGARVSEEPAAFILLLVVVTHLPTQHIPGERGINFHSCEIRVQILMLIRIGQFTLHSRDGVEEFCYVLCIVFAQLLVVGPTNPFQNLDVFQEYLLLYSAENFP
jgi:hypothetical protein